MRFVHLLLGSTLLYAACIPRRSPAPGAPGTPVVALPPGTPPPPPPPVAIHQVSEIEAPPIAVASEPVPGFMRGINLGNALDATQEGAWGVTLDENHFAMAKAAGLDHIRLPVRFNAHAKDQAPYTIEDSFFKRVDWALDRAAAHGLSIIIDLHHYDELMKKPAAHAERVVGLWKQVAERYRNRPASVAFELINEPCNELKSALLNPIHQRAIAAIRASNPTRLIFVDSYFWAGADYLKELELPPDPNVIASFHEYQPILFTHQNMPFMPGEFQTRGVVFPGPPEAPLTPVEVGQKTEWVSTWFASYNSQPIATNSNGPNAIFDYFKIVEEYIKSSKRRVYMGEFGVNDNADPQSRQEWLRLVRKEAEKRKIGWAVWDDGGKFRAMNVALGTWVAPIHAGLFE
ncbi:MAG TPA: glycoside hydrolase family 5 protein [Polyangiaceae bacterium]|nr:glycoside hydrolase family 5 protein [Polyangiaceae bacterium]